MLRESCKEIVIGKHPHGNCQNSLNNIRISGSRNKTSPHSEILEKKKDSDGLDSYLTEDILNPVNRLLRSKCRFLFESMLGGILMLKNPIRATQC